LTLSVESDSSALKAKYYGSVMLFFYYGIGQSMDYLELE